MKVRAWRGFHWFCSWQNLDDDEKVKRADAALTDVLRRLGLLTNDRWRELSDARRAFNGTPAATIEDAVNAAAAAVPARRPAVRPMTPRWRDPQWWLLLAYLPIWIVLRARAQRWRPDRPC